MLEVRPIVVDDNLCVLGGNMRLRAANELKITSIPVIKVSGLSEKQKQAFIIKDNVSFGNWDWSVLANEWEAEELVDWGMDVWIPEKNDENSTSPQPSSAIFEVSQDDINSAQSNLGNISNPTKRIYVDCECPSCKNKFQVEQ